MSHLFCIVWIIWTFIFVGNNNTTQSINTSATIHSHPTTEDQDIDNMYMFLDPSLQPVRPDPNEPESRQIYEEHKQLADEYLKVDTMSKNLTTFYKLIPKTPYS